MDNDHVQITQEGLEALKKELNELVEEKRPRLVERLANARSQGDLAENSDYQNAKDELEFLDGRISELEDVLKRTVVVKASSKNEVCFGVKVTLKYNGEEKVYELVGEWEADPSNRKISHTSPLGQALVGRKIGEEVEVEAPAGKVVYKIVKIH